MFTASALESVPIFMMVASSANLQTSEHGILVARSLMFINNNTGSDIDP